VPESNTLKTVPISNIRKKTSHDPGKMRGLLYAVLDWEVFRREVFCQRERIYVETQEK